MGEQGGKKNQGPVPEPVDDDKTTDKHVQPRPSRDEVRETADDTKRLDAEAAGGC